MTHPAQHFVDASKKRQRAWVEGRARGGNANRPGKAGALKGGASEDLTTQSDTLPLIPHIKSGKWPVADTVKAAEDQPERARGGSVRRADGGEAPYTGARTYDNRIDPSPATADRNEMRRLPSRDERDSAGKELSLAKGGKVPPIPIVKPGGDKGAGSNSPTSTDVRSPTRTSTATDAYTADNLTVTGGAGAGNTTVNVYGKSASGPEATQRRKEHSSATTGGKDVPERAKGGGVSAAERRNAEGKGETMPGGKFPIRNASDLANAKHDVGRASDPSAARRWINRRAKELGEPPLGG